MGSIPTASSIIISTGADMPAIKAVTEFIVKFVITAIVIAIINKVADGVWSLPQEQTILNYMFVVFAIEYFESRYNK